MKEMEFKISTDGVSMKLPFWGAIPRGVKDACFWKWTC